MSSLYEPMNPDGRQNRGGGGLFGAMPQQRQQDYYMGHSRHHPDDYIPFDQKIKQIHKNKIRYVDEDDGYFIDFYKNGKVREQSMYQKSDTLKFRGKTFSMPGRRAPEGNMNKLQKNNEKKYSCGKSGLEIFYDSGPNSGGLFSRSKSNTVEEDIGYKEMGSLFNDEEIRIIFKLKNKGKNFMIRTDDETKGNFVKFAVSEEYKRLYFLRFDKPEKKEGSMSLLELVVVPFSSLVKITQADE